MQLAPTAPGFVRSIVRIGPCAHWSEVNDLLERLRSLPQLAALDVAGIQDGVLTLDVCCPQSLPLQRLIAASLPETCSLSVRPADEEVVPGPSRDPTNGAAQPAPVHSPIGGENGYGGTNLNGHPPVVLHDSAFGAGADDGGSPVAARDSGAHAVGLYEPAPPVPLGGGSPHPESQAAGVAERSDGQGRTAAPAAPAAAALGARLLVALDGSRHAEEALAYIAGHFSAGCTEVHLMSVVDATEAGAMRVSIERSPAASYRRLYLRACAQDLRGFRVRCVVAAHADPAEALLAYAGGNAIDLIVMTAHGHSRHAAPPLGSVAETIVAKRRLPVLVLPGASARTGEAQA